MHRKKPEIFNDLEKFLNSGSIPEFIITGRIEKVLIGRQGKFRFEIHTRDEHNPPHFHVLSKDGSINASYSIETFECIKGCQKRLDKAIKDWLAREENRKKAKETWDDIQGKLDINPKI